jgi:hypothetical protein
VFAADVAAGARLPGTQQDVLLLLLLLLLVVVYLEIIRAKASGEAKFCSAEQVFALITHMRPHTDAYLLTHCCCCCCCRHLPPATVPLPIALPHTATQLCSTTRHQAQISWTL